MRRPDLGPLHERDFRLLFLASTISFTGSAFTNVALAFAILDLTGSKADLGFVLAARTLPTVVFLLVGGIWADRLPRHHVMVASNALSGLSQATVAGVYSYDALGSAALIPLGLAVAGPVADAIGTRATLFAAGTISLSATLAVLFVHDVRTLRRRGRVALSEPAFEVAT